jgi:hypothetical protein
MNRLLPQGILLVQSHLRAIRKRDLLRKDTHLLPRDHRQREDIHLVGPLINQEATMADHTIMIGTTTSLNNKEDCNKMIHQGNNNSNNNTMTIMSLRIRLRIRISLNK